MRVRVKGMIKRTISGICIALFMIIVFIFSGYPFVTNAFVSIISAMSIYEVLVITKYVEGKWLKAFAIILSVLIPFSSYLPHILDNYFILGFFTVVVILFMTMILYNNSFRFEHVCVIFCMSLIIPVLFSTIVMIREMSNGLYMMIFVFLTAWGSDCGGYIFGKMFGTSKFTPKISPKKTIEGVFGGVCSAVTGCLCLCAGVDIFFSEISVNYYLAVFYAVIGAVFAIMGDLSASVIKRCFGVKDFGSLIPGHGGIMDRFDSILFAAPSIYILMSISPVFIL